MKFQIQTKIKGKHGRAGTIETPHGTIQTPAFIPVGTKATVKAVTTDMVKNDIGAQAILANTYHLYLQPGTEVLKKNGGLHRFMNWQGPTFTDSGGFQAFSLGKSFDERKGKIAKRGSDEKTTEETREKSEERSELAYSVFDDDGVTFRSVIDGSKHRFTPERSIEIQHDIGADIIFAFDECISPFESLERQREAVARTTSWAGRCLQRHKELSEERAKEGQSNIALFGIVQGGRNEELRKQSAREIGAMGFDGFGIGGSFDKDDIGTAVGWVSSELPEDKPRHLLGIGEPEDLVLGIENGMDTFDCVAPTRLARNGTAYSSDGRLNLWNAKFVEDTGKLDTECDCSTCTGYTRSYLAHLFRAKEMLAATLVSVHNLHFLVNMAKQAREAILANRWQDFREDFYYRISRR